MPRFLPTICRDSARASFPTSEDSSIATLIFRCATRYWSPRAGAVMPTRQALAESHSYRAELENRSQLMGFAEAAPRPRRQKGDFLKYTITRVERQLAVIRRVSRHALGRISSLMMPRVVARRYWLSCAAYHTSPINAGRIPSQHSRFIRGLSERDYIIACFGLPIAIGRGRSLV